MLDRAIGVAGLSLALLFGVLQYYLPQFPSWAAHTGILAGTFLLGMSASLFFVHRSRVSSKKPAKTAMLRLHVYSDQRVPEVLQSENVFRWYYLRQVIATIAQDGTQTAVFPTTTVFISFEPEVEVSMFRVRSPNLVLPAHEVKDFNQRFAIVAFGGQMAEGTLELAVQPYASQHSAA